MASVVSPRRVARRPPCLRTTPRLPEFREPDVSKPENWKELATLANSIAMTLGPEPANAQRSPVTAIDIALEPDHTMVDHAQAANATLLKNFPQGFSLDATHHPHVSIFAGFVPTADLPPVYEVAGKVLAKENYTAWKLTAFKYYYVPMGPTGLGGIVIKPTPDLLRLQRELIDAVTPYTVRTATAAAFYTTPAEPGIHPSVIDYIATSMTNYTGENFNPHVTIGIGTIAFFRCDVGGAIHRLHLFASVRLCVSVRRFRRGPQATQGLPDKKLRCPSASRR